MTSLESPVSDGAFLLRRLQKIQARRFAARLIVVCGIIANAYRVTITVAPRRVRL
jgi:hypothetical protein